MKIPQALNGELRIVLKIEATENDKLGAEFYSIDQNPTTLNRLKQAGRESKSASRR
jgi:hypothetical protein